MNSERTETILPCVHRDDYNLHQRYLTTFLMVFVHSLSMFIIPAVPLPHSLPYSFQLWLHPAIHTHSVPFPYCFRIIISALCNWESFFCQATLDLANRKTCLVNNLPLGNKCLKCILHASLALFAMSALLKAENLPATQPKGFDKREIKNKRYCNNAIRQPIDYT